MNTFNSPVLAEDRACVYTTDKWEMMTRWHYYQWWWNYIWQRCDIVVADGSRQLWSRVWNVSGCQQPADAVLFHVWNWSASHADVSSSVLQSLVFVPRRCEQLCLAVVSPILWNGCQLCSFWWIQFGNLLKSFPFVKAVTLGDFFRCLV